mgnify:CR=1 FL=1|tara:strand:- start:237 stop:836 length:600 start_codon:yes stop_codon:yes gene_type:complete
MNTIITVVWVVVAFAGVVSASNLRTHVNPRVKLIAELEDNNLRLAEGKNGNDADTLLSEVKGNKNLLLLNDLPLSSMANDGSNYSDLVPAVFNTGAIDTEQADENSSGSNNDDANDRLPFFMMSHTFENPQSKDTMTGSLEAIKQAASNSVNNDGEQNDNAQNDNAQINDAQNDATTQFLHPLFQFSDNVAGDTDKQPD